MLARAIAGYVCLCRSWGQWSVFGDDVPRQFWREGRPFILAFWHGRLLMMPAAWPRHRTMSMLASEHRDGDLITRTVESFGVGTTRGSTTKGGSRAVRAMLSAVRKGEWVGITPDAPRGPYMRASAGAIQVARLAGVPIVPVSCSASSGLVLNSWDRFMVPSPFARGAYFWGQPIEVPRDADNAAVEAKRQELEDRLNDLSRIADQYCDRTPLRPVPLPQET